MTTRKWIAVLVVALLATQLGAEQKRALRTQKQKVGYCIGADVGKRLKRFASDVDVESLVQGIRDALAGEKLQMSDEEMQQTMEAFAAEHSQKDAGARGKAAEENKKAGEKFLAENKKKPGVVTRPSGLQYKVLTEGNGKKPTDADTVKCHYRGTLLDGTEFDSSYRRGQPAEFRVNGVIPGWTEALKLMPVGSKWQLFVPSQLAYGARGAGRDIGPNATLVFEVELIDIK
jgi:FKBP-type peptidyl-prolyl cis-trans isomerase